MRFLGFLLSVSILCSSFKAMSVEGSQCPEGQHWVHAYHRRAYYKADGTFVSATEVSAHCQGNPDNYHYWETKLKDGHPYQWLNKKEVSKSWTTEERERILEALGELPSGLWDNAIINIYRMNISQTTKGNPGSSIRGVTVLYDSAFDQAHNLAEVLCHELAHQNYLNLGQVDIASYAEENGWNNPKDIGGLNIWIPTRSSYVEPDGRDSPWEDYANNVQYFLFHPEKLHLVTPSAYDWIKYHFGDNFKVRGKR